MGGTRRQGPTVPLLERSGELGLYGVLSLDIHAYKLFNMLHRLLNLRSIHISVLRTPYCLTRYITNVPSYSKNQE
jgi:hypothetical protein